NGFAIDAMHTMQPFVPLATVSYDIRIEANSALVGANAFVQEAILDPLGDNLFLFWGANNQLWLFKSLNGSSFVGPTPTTFGWSFDTDYHVVWEINGATDTSSLSVNGTSLYT